MPGDAEGVVVAIGTTERLERLRKAGHGFVINEHYPRSDGTRKLTTLHRVGCRTLEGVDAGYKWFVEDDRHAHAWLFRHKGPQGATWTTCDLCGMRIR